MNMKTIIILFLLIITEGANAQVTFYVSPVVNIKGHYRSTFGNQFYSKLSYENEYFEYQSRRLIFSSLGFGIKGGVSLKNRWLFEFGWSQDEARSGARVHETLFKNYMTNYGYNNYIPYSASAYMGVITNRLYLSSHYKLINPDKFKKNTLWVVPYINLGLGLNINTYKTPNYHQLAFEGDYNLINQNDALKVDHYLNVGQRVNVHGQIGLSTDFMFKKHYLFSFSVYSTFTGKARKMNRDLASVDTGTEVKKFNFNDGSRGTGLYFEFSRRFQLYPWIKSKKKLEREKDKL